MEPTLSDKVAQAADGGTTISQGASERQSVEKETMTSQLSNMSLEESSASLKNQELTPMLGRSPIPPKKGIATGESKSPIKPFKQGNQDMHPPPDKVTGKSSSDTAVMPSKHQSVLTKPVEDSSKASHSTSAAPQQRTLTEAELRDPLRFMLTVPSSDSSSMNMRVPTRPRTPKAPRRVEKMASLKMMLGMLPTSASSKRPSAELKAPQLQQPEVNPEAEEISSEMVDMLFDDTEMEEDEKTLVPPISSSAMWSDGGEVMMNTMVHPVGGSVSKKESKGTENSAATAKKSKKDPIVPTKSLSNKYGKMPVLEKAENQPVSTKGKERVEAEDTEDVAIDQPLTSALDRMKGRPYNLRKRAASWFARTINPAHFTRLAAQAAERIKNLCSGRIQKRRRQRRNKKKKKEDEPVLSVIFRFTLTEEEIAEDLYAMTKSMSPRETVRRPPEIQRIIENQCPKVEFHISSTSYD